MSNAETAYVAALEAIQHAKETSATELSFAGVAYRSLVSIPNEISEIATLRTLSLERTQIADLAPIQHLTALQTLSLPQTRVSDITALKYLRV